MRCNRCGKDFKDGAFGYCRWCLSDKWLFQQSPPFVVPKVPAEPEALGDSLPLCREVAYRIWEALSQIIRNDRERVLDAVEWMIEGVYQDRFDELRERLLK